MFFSLFFALTAILFSAWNVWFKDSLFCLTEACHVFDTFTVLGISLWQYSFVFFLVLALLFMIFSLKQKFRSFISFLLVIALFCDIALLCLMLITAPCFNCLIIALLLALTYYSYFKTQKNKTSFTSALLLFWSLLFIINAGAIVRHSINPYAIYINPVHQEQVTNASMRIYFSPSCTACNEIVNLLGTEEMTKQGDIAWFPVAESSHDVVLVRQMQEYIDSGLSLKEALVKTLENPQNYSFAHFFSDFIMQCRLLINQARLSFAGTSRIPFVEYTGIPAHLSVKEHRSSELDTLRSLSPSYTQESSFSLGVGGFCDDASTEPCE